MIRNSNMQEFVPIIARQSSVIRELRQTRRAENTIPTPALSAFSAFSEGIIDRLIRRDLGAWGRFSLHYLEREESESMLASQVNNYNNIYLRLLLNQRETSQRQQEKLAGNREASTAPPVKRQKEARLSIPTAMHKAFMIREQPRQLSFAENTYYRQILAMAASYAVLPASPVSPDVPSWLALPALPESDTRRLAHTVNLLRRTELMHIEQETGIPAAAATQFRDMTHTVRELQREVTILMDKPGTQAETEAPRRQRQAYRPGMPLTPRSAITAQQVLRTVQQALLPVATQLRQIRKPAETIRFVPPAYINPYGGKHPMGKLEWADFGFMPDGAAPKQQQRAETLQRTAAAKLQKPAAEQEETQPQQGEPAVRSLHPAEAAWEDNELVQAQSIPTAAAQAKTTAQQAETPHRSVQPQEMGVVLPTGIVATADEQAPAAPVYLEQVETAEHIRPGVRSSEDDRAQDAAMFFESYAQLYPAADTEADDALPQGSVIPARTVGYSAQETAYLEGQVQNNVMRRMRVHSLNNEFSVKTDSAPLSEAKLINRITDEVFDRISKQIRSERRRYGF